MSDRKAIKSVNWHITDKCNYHCKFCFSQRLDKEINDLKVAGQLLRDLKDHGLEKINFAGGEPMLHPLIYDFTRIAKSMNFIVSITTNGSLISEQTIDRFDGNMDWVGLSIDSKYESTEKSIGRGHGNHVSKIINAAGIVHAANINLKINTTLTKLNYGEDMRPLIKILDPKRWKVFQMLHIQGQNDNCVNELAITDHEFQEFRTINENMRLSNGAKPVFENAIDMVDSYLMISPSGNLLQNTGRVTKILDLKKVCLSNVNNLVDVTKYNNRGGVYDWTTKMI